MNSWEKIKSLKLAIYQYEKELEVNEYNQWAKEISEGLKELLAYLISLEYLKEMLNRIIDCDDLSQTFIINLNAEMYHILREWLLND